MVKITGHQKPQENGAYLVHVFTYGWCIIQALGGPGAD